MANIGKSDVSPGKLDISIKEGYNIVGELMRQTSLYLKLMEVLGIALQAEGDQASNQKMIDRLKVEREKMETEHKEFVAEIAFEKEEVQSDLNDLKARAEGIKKEIADSADKDTQANFNRAASLREEIGGLTKQRDGVLAGIPSAKARAEVEIAGYRKKVGFEKDKVDDELSHSQNKLKAFKTNIAGLPNQ